MFTANKFADCYKQLAIYTTVISDGNCKLLLLMLMIIMLINVSANYTLKTHINSIVIGEKGSKIITQTQKKPGLLL